MSSEIKRLLEQIEAEQLAALRGLSGLASVARHDFIQVKQACIDKCHGRLLELVGEAATQVVADVIDTTIVWYECEQQRRERMRPQREIERDNISQSIHQTIRRQPYAGAHVGDTLVYKLKPSDRPVEPDRLWHGTIRQILVDCYNKRTYFVESREYPGCCEMVYPFQIVRCDPASQEPESHT